MGFPVGPDAFTGTSGTALHTYNASWTEQRPSDATCEISGVGGGTPNTVRAAAGGSEAGAKWDGDTFTNPDQYAQCKAVNAANYGGATARMSGVTVATQTGYVFFATGGGNLLQRYDNGVRTGLQSGMGTAAAAGDTGKIEVVGSTIKCYVNGVQVGTDQSDSNYATGQPGIAFLNATTAELDDWTADTIPTGGGGAISAAQMIGIFDQLLSGCSIGRVDG